MAREEARGKRPFKIWDSWRNVRKGIVVNSFEELLHRGKEKLGVPQNEPVRFVLDTDGTQVEDGEYFRTLPNNTVLILLRPGEKWYPIGVDVIRAAITAIPKIVCETIHALELHDETPSWKIMDNKGRITVVLHWDQRHGTGRGSSTISGVGSGDVSPSSQKFSPSKKQPSLDSTTGKSSASGATASSPYGIIHHHHHGSQPTANRLLHRQGSSSFESTTIHIHTPECANHAHHPQQLNAQQQQRQSGSPSNGVVECDFHCCALHEEGRKIAVHKSVATSPIQDAQQQTSPQPTLSSLADGRRSMAKGTGHVRFLDVVDRHVSQADLQHESSESETENTIIEDEALTSEKFLLLIDQLSVDQKRHLSIKDIGIILERLSSKILDVERLDRESESEDCYNWTIKATIRGSALRELGVIYNGNYYAISEHPGYKEENEEINEEVDEEEEEDRL